MRRVVIALLLVVGTIWAASMAMANPPAPVQVHSVGKGLVERLVTNSRAGIIKARRQSQMASQVAGVIQSIQCREGTMVKEGALLFQLDPSRHGHAVDRQMAALELARGRLAEAQANASLARRSAERSEKLKVSDQISQQELDASLLAATAAEAAMAAATAAVKEAEALLANARYELTCCSITSPYAAVVSNRFREVGEHVIPGAPVLEIIAMDSLYVSVDIDETDMGAMKTGLPARVRLDPYKNTVFQGRVTRVSPSLTTLEKQNRTLEVEITLDAWDDTQTPLRPGVSADCEIILDTRESVLRIPSHSILDGQRVFAVEGNVIVERPVTLGTRNWEWSEVLEGLKAEDKIVMTLDRDDIKPGATVTVATP
ncbi:MAG: efflux RND transporter periplasmic adaptor subunit [Planctomycetota bacterium]